MEKNFMLIVILSLVKKLSFKTSLINLNTYQSSFLRNNQVKEGMFFRTWVEDLEIVPAIKKIS
jgi:hypothetical protein